MKSIAELKAELEEAWRIKAFGHADIIRAEIRGMQYVSQKISEDVEKCEEVVNLGYDYEVSSLCKALPEADKCEGCKRALEIKMWLE
jgi:hypothetical protein